MPENNGETTRKDTAVMETQEVRPSGAEPNVAVPDSDNGSTKVRSARGIFQNHPWKILAIIVAVVLGAGYFIRSAFRYEYTDDAQVDGHIMPLSSRISGYVLDVPVIEGQLVHAGDLLVSIDPKDYNIAVDQAEATLADAQSNAAGALFNVPITSITTQSNLDSAGTAVINAQAGL